MVFPLSSFSSRLEPDASRLDSTRHELRQNEHKGVIFDRALDFAKPSIDLVPRDHSRIARVSREAGAEHRERAPIGIGAGEDLDLDVLEPRGTEQAVELPPDLRLPDCDRLRGGHYCV